MHGQHASPFNGIFTFDGIDDGGDDEFYDGGDGWCLLFCHGAYDIQKVCSFFSNQADYFRLQDKYFHVPIRFKKYLDPMDFFRSRTH